MTCSLAVGSGRSSGTTLALSTVVPGALRACVLAMGHDGHLGIVRFKQRCRNVWWPSIDRDIETLVKDCTACLLGGKTRAPAPPHVALFRAPPSTQAGSGVKSGLSLSLDHEMADRADGT